MIRVRGGSIDYIYRLSAAIYRIGEANRQDREIGDDALTSRRLLVVAGPRDAVN